MKCDVIAAGIVNAAKGVSSSYVVLLTKKVSCHDTRCYKWTP